MKSYLEFQLEKVRSVIKKFDEEERALYDDVVLRDIEDIDWKIIEAALTHYIEDEEQP